MMFTKFSRIPFKELIQQPENFLTQDQGLAAGTTVRGGIPFSSTRSFDPSVSKQNTKADYLFSDILTDTGSGRVSRGLRSLEFLNALCYGASPESLFLFDNIKYSYSPTEVKRADTTRLQKIVYDNLGMTEVVENANPLYTADFLETCLKIGNDVKLGVFSKNSYRRLVLAQAKNATKLYLRSDI